MVGLVPRHRWNAPRCVRGRRQSGLTDPVHSHDDAEPETPAVLGRFDLLRGTTLTDEQAGNHVSSLERQAPLPGRELRLSYSRSF